MAAAITQLHDRRCATARNVAAMRRAVVNLAARSGATDDQLRDIAIAVSEALTNAATHAYTGTRAGPVVLDAALEDDVLQVSISDVGVGMPPVSARPHTGLGLAIIARAADGVQLRDAAPGTCVRMRFLIG